MQHAQKQNLRCILPRDVRTLTFNLWCILPRDVRTLTFSQKNRFSIKPLKTKLVAGEQNATEKRSTCCFAGNSGEA